MCASAEARPCRVRGALPNPGTGDPLGLVHRGAGVRQPPDVLHGQDEVPRGLEQLDRLVVQDGEEAPPVGLQDLVPNLSRPAHNSHLGCLQDSDSGWGLHSSIPILWPACRGGGRGKIREVCACLRVTQQGRAKLASNSKPEPRILLGERAPAQPSKALRGRSAAPKSPFVEISHLQAETGVGWGVNLMVG